MAETTERGDRATGAVTPQLAPGYPGFDVLAQADHWDSLTREVVLARVEDVPELRFFSDPEARTLGAFCDLVMAQDREPKVPVLNMIDAKLFEGRLDGFRYEDMPDDRETWRLVARGLDVAVVQHGHDADYAQAPEPVRKQVIQAFSEGKLHGEVWDQLNVARAWSVVMRSVLDAFYSHPWAWNEIGFGGPAYPRGYARLGLGQREVWEGGR